jgi:uncharacterized membrane protein
MESVADQLQRESAMHKNMGTLDRTVRIAVAIVVAVLYFTGQISGILAAVLGLFAVIFLVTSFVGSCPLYSAIGLSTRKGE